MFTMARSRVDELQVSVADPDDRPGSIPAEQHQMIDAIHTDERRKVVSGIRVEDDPRFGRPRCRIAARCARNNAGQDPGAKNQRDVGIERIECFVNQPIQVEHVRAAPGENRPNHRQWGIAALHLAALEIDEERHALGRVLRHPRELGDEPRDAGAEGHESV
jgi:hypothetical protein